MFEQIPTPSLLLDRDRTQRNITRMQALCDAHGVALWPHIKTHKMLEVARMQLAAGARGLVCAKLGEAEVMLDSGVRRLFLAHSLVDPLQAPRIRALSERLDELILAVTSEGQAEALDCVLARAEVTLPVMLALDTGLGREGVRGVENAARVAEHIGRLPHLRLKGIYTHEGHSQAAPKGEEEKAGAAVLEQLLALRDKLDASLEIWPGCSVTAHWMATQPGVTAVRPGTYVFGDLSLTVTHNLMDWDDLAVTVLATVVDRPEPALALLDAGSKTFSGDKSAAGLSGSFYDRRDIHVSRVNEEHGYAMGSDVDTLRIGERVRVVPGHICPCVNLFDEVVVISNNEVVDKWRVAARGRVQ